MSAYLTIPDTIDFLIANNWTSVAGDSVIILMFGQEIIYVRNLMLIHCVIVFF